MNDQIKEVFKNNIIGTLATVSEDGSPWASPLHFVANDEGIYWFSSEETKHSKNISLNPRVSLVLPSVDTSSGLKGIYVNGTVTKANKDDRETAFRLIEDRLGALPPSFQSAGVYFLPFGNLDEEKSTGGCWYFYN